MTRLLPLILALLAVAAAGGCSDTSCDNLCGPMDYDLTYDREVIQRQEQGGDPAAMIIRYERDNKAGVELPAKVVVKWMEQQQTWSEDCKNEGSVTRVTSNNVQFPELESCVLTFDKIGGVGDEAKGEFYATFVDGKGTLNGKFSGKIELLSF